MERGEERRDERVERKGREYSDRWDISTRRESRQKEI
jgi:hypothetical protein